MILWRACTSVAFIVGSRALPLDSAKVRGLKSMPTIGNPLSESVALPVPPQEKSAFVCLLAREFQHTR